MISIIIPAFDEHDRIGTLVRYLREHGSATEIIVADGGSRDRTVAEARSAGARVIISPIKGRAAQMNHGAKAASGDTLYFLHADSTPPPEFVHDIEAAVKRGFSGGSYRLAFDHDHWFLRLSCWFTRLNWNAIRFGDQSLFVTADTFRRCGGFDGRMIVMEDQEIVRRIRRHGRFTVLNGIVTTSARKYLDNGVLRMQAIFGLICAMYWLGASQRRLVTTYRTLIRQDKL